MMRAETTGEFEIKCICCGNTAWVPKEYMAFCAPCADQVFQKGACRRCGAKVTVEAGGSGDDAPRIFVHEEGPIARQHAEAVSASNRYSDFASYVPDAPWCTGNPNAIVTFPPEEFEPFPKIARLNRPVTVTEKIDGTNCLVYIRQPCLRCDQDFRPPNPEGVDGCCNAPLLSTKKTIHAGSKSIWLTPEMDHHGFAAWVRDNHQELLKLGAGRHRGEWYGAGINGNLHQMKDKRFALFNTKFADGNEWASRRPACCEVVPLLYQGPFDTKVINDLAADLRINGSRLHPGKRAEGVVVFHAASSTGFKVTCLRDEEPKGKHNAGVA